MFDGYESQAATSAAQVTTGSSSTITVTAPASVAGATGFHVYLSAVGGGGASAHYSTQFANAPFGANVVLTTPPNVNVGRVIPGSLGLPLGGSVGGGTTNTAGFNNGEGYAYSVGDLTDDGSVALSISATSNVYSPTVILGLPKDGVMRPSVAVVGDSIMAGLGDYGYRSGFGGCVDRACSGQLALQYVYPTNPVMGFGRFALAGETAAVFVGPRPPGSGGG